MNSTNRGANRLLILLVGLLLLVVGAGAAAVVLVPALRDAGKDIGGRLTEQMSAWLAETPLGDTGVSWILPAILVLVVVAIILLIVFIARQGRGHTGIVLDERPSDHGRTVVESSVAQQMLQEVVGARPEFVSSHVSTYRVRRTPVLKVSVTCRRGVSPRDAAMIVEDAVVALDELLGRQLPALVHISGGFRSRVTSTTRLQ
ncbi:hypothetical protein N1027_18720 [Herbiconiux sp. CPCC 205763]|uniref:Alkaline shock response membrane anchor protein AmaP n=1 Tax=Herbiconiux aconitum TaxID=2970913 RepID=A0ABT2GVC5_9MICO|nr:hypothetical protein [Herbiconiux aconitum]MCS5720170.1 hypothetical protein [Herbiconiux aconitum]